MSESKNFLNRILGWVETSQTGVAVLFYVLGIITFSPPFLSHEFWVHLREWVWAAPLGTIITSPQSGRVSGSEILLEGRAPQEGKGRYIFVFVQKTAPLDHWIVADRRRLDDPFRWKATARLNTVPPGDKIRIHVRLCSFEDTYSVPSILLSPPKAGRPSNTVEIWR